ncbi:MAG: hypothetical protein JWM44_1297 [Bacilli bacterium]|nr:hypothetical protein [Bacilli bacterium]
MDKTVYVGRIDRRKNCEVHFTFSNKVNFLAFSRSLVSEQISHEVNFKNMSVTVLANKV